MNTIDEAGHDCRRKRAMSPTTTVPTRPYNAAKKEDEEYKVVPIDKLVDVPEGERRIQEFGGSAAISGPIVVI